MDRTEPREITESFRLERVLKSSRSAIVFRAVEPGTGTTVAIKLIPPSSPATLETCRERFLGAMGVLAATAPEAFPALLDYGFSPDGSAFMVMETVEGERLDTLGGMAGERVLHLVLDALDGLEALAGSGTWHGNLAPENLLALYHAEGDRVRVLGFGTAAFHGSVAGAGAAGLAEGPAQFAAPERLEPATAATADWRSDLYALAATTCALLQAEIVPADAPAPEVMLPPHVRATLHDPAALQAVLAQSLRHDPAARPATYDEFRSAVRRALDPSWAGPAAVESAGPRAARTLTITPPALFTPLSAEEPGNDEPGQTAETQPNETEDTAPRAVVPVVPPRAGGAGAPEADAGAHLAVPAQDEPVGGPAASGLPLPPPVEAPEAGPIETPGVPHPAQSFEEAPASSSVVAPPEVGPSSGPPVEPAVLATPAPPATPEPPPATAPAPAPEAAPVAPAAKAPRRRSALPLALGVGAVVVLGVAVGGFWLWSQQTGRPVAPAQPTAAPRRPTPSPEPVRASNAAEQLAKAEAAVALADLPAASAALDAITPAELAGLSQAERERYGTLRTKYGDLRRQALTREMQRAIGAGNLKALGDAVRGISRDEETSFKRDADFAASFDEARRALTVQTTLLKAQRSGDQGQVLQSASVLNEIVPRYAPAAEAREKAASALERDADTLAGKGNFAAALDRLETVRRSWPARAGLQARVERIQADQESDRKLGAVLAQAEQSAAEKAPERGLELLRSVAPDPRGAERVASVRERLTAQLAQLDAQPPAVALAPGFKLEYKKGEPVTIPLRIQDDHGVKSAQLFARVEGAGRYVELPMRRGSGADWTAEISTAFHQNQTVEFYVTATDHSGHVGQLGKAQDPIRLKRKKNIFGF